MIIWSQCRSGLHRSCLAYTALSTYIWKSISKWGLVAGGLALDRDHVHCTPFSPDQRRKGDSWIREDSEVLVQVHMEKAFKAGIKFFKSENNAPVPQRSP